MTAGDQEDAPRTFRARMPPRYSTIVLLLGVAVTILVPVSMAAEGMIGSVVVAVVLAALFLAIALLQVSVRLDADEVRIALGGIPMTGIPYRRIDDVVPGMPTGLKYGMGLRILPDATTGYLVGGPSVRITTGSTAVLVSCSAPEELSDAIGRRRASTLP